MNWTVKDINGKGLDWYGKDLLRHNKSGNIYSIKGDILKLISENKRWSWIKIGDWIEALIHTITFGFGERISLFIASLFGKTDCGCCERQLWLNRLTNPTIPNECGKLK